MKLLPLLLLAGLVTGCAFNKTRLKPLDASAVIRGKQAEKTELIVKSPILWLYATPPSYEEIGQLPTGTYVPEGTDGRYIYYRAPGPVSYSLRLSHYAQDSKKRKGVGGIYIKLAGTASKAGVYFKGDTHAERVLEANESFYKEEGSTWILKDKQ